MDEDFHQLAGDIRAWGAELGFQQVGIAGVDLATAEARLAEWLDRGFHGDLGYMARHGTRRSRPGELVPGTVRVISARMDCWPARAAAALAEILLHRGKDLRAFGPGCGCVVKVNRQKGCTSYRDYITTGWERQSSGVWQHNRGQGFCGKKDYRRSR